MRVISGSVGGIALKSVPGSGTRPTSDKVKEAMFSMIGPYFDGGSVLDLFAGTGGLGIEALSRGMDHAVFIDSNRKAIEVVRENLQVTRLDEQAEVYANDALRALKALAKRDIQFDLVLIDPPYEQKQGKGKSRPSNQNSSNHVRFLESLLVTLESADLLKQQATVVVEHDIISVYSKEYGALKLIKQPIYGDTALSIYKVQS